MVEYMIFRMAGTGLKPKRCGYTDLPKLSSVYSDWIKPLGEDSVLVPEGEFGEYWKMRFGGTCLTKKPGSAETAPRARVSYSVWLKKDGSLLCCFAPRFFARGIAVLAATQACGGKPKVSEVEITTEGYHRLAKYVLEHGGEIKWLALREVNFMGLYTKRIELVGVKGRTSAIRVLLKGAEEIQKMGFQQEGILWTTSKWGGGQILAPVNPGDEVLLKLLDVLRQTIL